MMYVVEEEIYSILFFFLFVTSLLYRLFPTVYLFLLLDKLAIMYVVLYGALCLWEKTFHEIEILMIVFTFVCVLYLYYGGYRTKSFCFSEIREQADMWHAFLHLLVCFGHSMIVL